MALVTPQIEEYIETQSWIRRMFEAAAELKAEKGAENVFDFSLGNPDVPPPAQVGEALADLANRVQHPLALGYCPNAGLPAALIIDFDYPYWRTRHDTVDKISAESLRRVGDVLETLLEGEQGDIDPVGD